MKISIVIPVYKTEKTLENLVKEIFKIFSKDEAEVIFVYDCGNLNSWHILESIHKKYTAKDYKITCIRLSKNYGQHNATICGFEHASNQIIVTMDDDLQHPPQDILKLIDKQKETNADLIYGKYRSLSQSLFRNTTSIIVKRILKHILPNLHPEYTSFRLVKKEIAIKTTTMTDSYTFLDGYLSWLTDKVEYVKINHHSRADNEDSSYNTKKLIKHLLNIIIIFTNWPLRLITITSLTCLTSTVIYSSYIVTRNYLYNDLQKGFPSLIITILICTSMIMLSIGIIGEYIFKINLKTSKQPTYNYSEKL